MHYGISYLKTLVWTMQAWHDMTDIEHGLSTHLLKPTCKIKLGLSKAVSTSGEPYLMLETVGVAMNSNEVMSKGTVIYYVV